MQLRHKTELALQLCFSPSLIPEYWEPRCVMEAPLVGSQMECLNYSISNQKAIIKENWDYFLNFTVINCLVRALGPDLSNI